MRRLPIYFLVDVSESMVGVPIEQVQNGMRNIIQDLRTDPYALETAFVSIIVFAGKAQVLSPLTELSRFYPPTFPVGGGTSLGAGLLALMHEFDTRLNPTTEQQKGDWKPLVFLFTDGTPTDDYSTAFASWNRKYRRKANLVAVSIGDNVNTQILGQISDHVLRLNDTDEQSFRDFFKWVTASIKATSLSVSDFNNDDAQLVDGERFNLEKVDTTQNSAVDENFVVLLSKCSITQKPFLIKYAKRNEKRSELIPGLYHTECEYSLVGAYPIDEVSYTKLSDGQSNHRINSNELRGVPNCPCCGAQIGAVYCGRCGQLMCVAENTAKCPHCGMEGALGRGEQQGFDLSRGKG